MWIGVFVIEASFRCFPLYLLYLIGVPWWIVRLAQIAALGHCVHSFWNVRFQYDNWRESINSITNYAVREVARIGYIDVQSLEQVRLQMQL